MERHNDDLDIDQHASLEEKFWTIQRIGWFVMFLIILAALFGFTGRGGIAGINHIKKTTPSQVMEVAYDRFHRNQVSDEIKVKLQQIQTDTPSITFSKAFYEKIRVEQVVPEPEGVEVNAEEIKYTFSMSRPGGNIVFYTKPMHTGSLDFTAKGPSNEVVTISLFVYP